LHAEHRNISGPTTYYGPEFTARAVREWLGRIGVRTLSWEKWIRWLMPLVLIWLALGMAAVVIAQALHLGPF
jgi:hypothetical protein